MYNCNSYGREDIEDTNFKLCAASKELKKGVCDIREGIGYLNDGIKDIEQCRICEGINELKECEKDVCEGLNDISRGFKYLGCDFERYGECRFDCDNMHGTCEGLREITDGIKELRKALKEVNEGLREIEQCKICEGLKELKECRKNLNKGVKDITDGLRSLFCIT